MIKISSTETRRWRQWAESLAVFVRYNAGLIFAGRFVYFLFLAAALFLTTVIIYTVEENTPPGIEDVYYFLLAPGVFLVFYPAVYSIQSDADAEMIETLFGIPDYRYKVWLVRMVVQFLVVAALLTTLALFCRLTLADFPVLSMIYQLMYPIVFIGCFSFMLATLIRNGNGTAAVMVVFLLIVWMAFEPLNGTRWNLFHNPFEEVEAFRVLLWEEITLYNRIILISASILSLLMALLQLQKREKFI